MIIESFKNHFESKFKVYEKSLKKNDNTYYFLVRDLDTQERYLVVQGSEKFLNVEFQEKYQIDNKTYYLYKASHEVLMLLRNIFPELNPGVCGLRKSFGTGDRLGITTPGHIRALNGSKIFPFFAQQSVRENERTRRNWKNVLDDAIWGIFQEGYLGEFGADADHIKYEEDLLKAIESGFTMYTIDPSDYVRNLSSLSEEEKNKIFSSILEKDNLEKKYLGKTYVFGNTKLEFTPKSLRDAAVVYYDAIEHVGNMYKVLKSKIENFDFEISVDETETPTSPLFHVFIVEELRKRDVIFTNLALRFIGEWEKGVDYKGNIELFGKDLELHSEISKQFGNYKLSLHSGSDKFSIYSIFAEKTDGLFHIKTAGTSYLEALKVILMVNLELFKEIYEFSLTRFAEDKKSYHISADLSRIPQSINENITIELFKNDDVRQMLHVTYGSVLNNNHLKEELFKTLVNFEEVYYNTVASHIKRHIDLL